MQRSESTEPFDGIHVRGLSPPGVPELLAQRFQGKGQVRSLKNRGVRLMRLEYNYDEPLDDIKERGKDALVAVLETRGAEWKEKNPGWRPVAIGASAGVKVAEHVVDHFNADPYIPVKARVIGISGRRQEGSYPQGHPDSLERRARNGKAPVFQEAVVTPTGVAADDIQLIGPEDGDSVVKRKEMWETDADGNIAASPEFVTIEGLKHAWGGLDHVVGIGRGYDEIGKNKLGEVVVGKQFHHPQ